jgi:predicted metal-binding membrane protein
MMAPASLLVLQLWNTTQSLSTLPHGLRPPGTWTFAGLAVFLAAWMLMTTAMMLPSAMPLLISLDRIGRNQPSRYQIPIFATLAYLGVWGIVGVAAWISSAASQAYILPQASGYVVSRLAGACLVLAGLYGLSPIARACLRACRRPFGFLARYWRGGLGARLQAVRIGWAYGISCVGCCVPMLGIMFVVGMTNMAIMIAMGIVMVVMKSSSIGPRVAILVAITLVGTGVAVGMAWLPLSVHRH